MEDLPTLFVSSRTHTKDLIGAAQEIFKALGIMEWEERESSNYPPDGHYAVAYASNVTVEVYDTDDDRLGDYPFTVSCSRPTYRKGTEAVSETSSEIATILAAGGFEVLIPLGPWWLTEWDRQGIEHKAEQAVSPNGP